jgi:hypothetical protein
VAKEVDMVKVLTVLKNALPDDDHTAQQLATVLRDFQKLHARLFDWKELHNALNDLIVALDPFKLAVERAYTDRRRPDLIALGRDWRATNQKAELVIGLAKQTNSICDQPFAIIATGVQGPDWAVELYTGGRRLEDLLNLKKPDMAELYDAAFDFDDADQRHMFWADKQLRETTSGLFSLSEVVLRSMGNDNAL